MKWHRAGRYWFDASQITHEDALPDMTAEEYGKWFANSWVDGVRVGPKPVLEQLWRANAP